MKIGANHPQRNRRSLWARIAIGLFLITPLAMAEQSAGGPYRFTRDEVNAGGQFHATGGAYTLSGSVDYLPNTGVHAGGSYKNQSGLQSVAYYPNNVASLSLSSTTANYDTQMRLDWVEPGIFHDDTPGGVTVGGYRVRQLQGASMTEAEFNSGATSNVTGAIPSPTGVGTSVGMLVTGLSYNRSYTFGIRAHDPGSANPRGESYRIIAQTRATLPQRPSIVSVLPVANRSKQLDVTFNLLNPSSYSLSYEVQVARDTNFSIGLKTITGSSSSSGNVTVRFGVPPPGSNELQQDTLYYARVRTRGVALVYTPYSDLGSGTTGSTAAGITLTGAGPSSVSVNIVNSEFGTESRPEWSSDGSPPWNSTVSTTSSGSYSATLTGLFANTTYYVRAAIYDPYPTLLSATNLPAPNFPLVTGVLNPVPQPTTADAVSGTLNWTYPLDNNGAGGPVAGSYSFLFQISKDDFASVASQVLIPYDAVDQIGAHTFGSLESNTIYKTSVTAFNRLGTNTYSDAASRLLFPLFYTAPNTPGSVSFLSTADPTSKVKVGWAANGNSPTTQYRVELSTDNFSSLEAAPTVSGAFEYTFESPIHNILANQQYYVRIKALPIAGSDKADSAYAVVGSTFTKPLEGRILSVTPAALTMNVSFSSTSASGVQKNNAATRYEMTWPPAVGNRFPLQSPTLSHNIVGLTYNTTYTVTVRTEANVTGGWNDVSVSTQRVTLANVPSFNAGAIVLATSSINVAWSRNGNPVGTLFEAQTADNDAFAGIVTSSFTRNATATFGGFVPNTPHYFHVKAINHEGFPTVFDPVLPSLAYTLPNAPLVIAYGTPDEYTLDLNWNKQGNSAATEYQVRQLPGAFGGFLPDADTWTFNGLTPDTMYSYQVRANHLGGDAGDADSLVSSTCTLAQRPAGATIRAFAGAGAITINIFQGDNRPATEYAFELLDKNDNQMGYMEPLILGGVRCMQLKSAGAATPAWAAIQNGWGTLSTDIPPDAPGTHIVKVIGLVNDPANVPKLRIYARNQVGRVTLPSDTLELVFPAGPPVVTLTTREGVFTATQSYSTNVYYSTTAAGQPIPFEAAGSGHYNFLLNNAAPLSPPMFSVTPPISTRYQTERGWNGGVGGDLSPCWDDPSVEPTSNVALRFCTGGTEGVYYLHIVGDRLAQNISGNLFVDTPFYIESFPEAKQSYFRVLVDFTAPDPGAVRAFADGFEIPNANVDRLGFQTLSFQWHNFVDGGNAASRSPIVGWSFSFSENIADDPPQLTSGAQFVAHAPTPTKVINLGPVASLPDETTYYFKVIGMDRAGNWTGAPQVFTYNFKKDVIEPHFSGAALSGHRLPKGTGNEFHYAAVDPTAPLFLTFTEPMNLLGAGAVRFVRTHDAAGNQTPVDVVFAANANVVDSTTTIMEVTAPLEYGARYEFITSTTNLRDLGGNRLPAAEKFSIVFFTLADGGPMTIRSGAAGQEVRLEVAAGALGVAPSGISFDDNVAGDGHPTGQMVTRANGAMARRSGGAYNQVLSAKEFVQYEPSGTKVTTAVLAPVRVVFPYDFLDQDGAPGDGKLANVPSGRPIYEDRLAIYKLDERSGAWIKMPGTVLDTGLQEASLQVQSFGIYALMGTPSFSLTDAHPFPVPYRASEDNGAGITFVFPGAQIATVKIFTLDGRLVRTLHENTGAGLVSWYPVNTDGGEPVGSDVYIYVIENDQDRRVGKLVIIR